MSSAFAGFFHGARALARLCDPDLLLRFPTAETLWPQAPLGGGLFDRLPLSKERVRVRLADGRARELELAWRSCDRADPRAPTIVLIPGLGDSAETFRILVEALAPIARLVLVDPPGFGRSELWPTREAFRAEVLRDALRELVVQRGWNRPSTILLGNSLGGALALGIVAALGPRNRIGRLVLLAPAAFPQELSFWIRAQRLPAHAAFAHWVPKRMLAAVALCASVGDPRCVARESVQDLVRHLERPYGLRAFQHLARDLARLCREARRGRNNILSALVPKCARTRARRSSGERVPLEVLLLHGDRDRVVPAWVAERLEREMPRVERHCWSGVGHLPQLERPFEVAVAVQRFLERTAAESAAEGDAAAAG
ncbi:MAG: alpha/beta fold hydrolase [Planctomycetes bacterium]|nr:alpha/beta fold hydrolase [Planctomycetota bacterium]